MRRREDALSPWHYPPLALRASASLINRPPSCPRPGGCTQPRSNDSEKKKKEGKRKKGERKSKSVKMKNYREPFERTRLKEASFVRRGKTGQTSREKCSLLFFSPLLFFSYLLPSAALLRARGPQCLFPAPRANLIPQLSFFQR